MWALHLLQCEGVALPPLKDTVSKCHCGSRETLLSWELPSQRLYLVLRLQKQEKCWFTDSAVWGALRERLQQAEMAKDPCLLGASRLLRAQGNVLSPKLLKETGEETGLAGTLDTQGTECSLECGCYSSGVNLQEAAGQGLRMLIARNAGPGQGLKSQRRVPSSETLKLGQGLF